jgi:hypothetical protein
MINKWLLIRLFASEHQWAQLVLQWIDLIDAHQLVPPKVKHLVLQLLITRDLILSYIHLPKIRHETPRTITLCKLMLLHQGNYGLVHNLVYIAAMTVAFNINMIVWNLGKKKENNT